MKKDNQTMLIIAALGIAAYFFIFKKKPRKRGTIIVEDSRHIEFLPPKKKAEIKNRVNKLKLNPIVDKEEYFKTLYKESLNNCSY